MATPRRRAQNENTAQPTTTGEDDQSSHQTAPRPDNNPWPTESPLTDESDEHAKWLGIGAW